MMRAGRGLAIEARRAARGRRFDPTVAQTSQTLVWICLKTRQLPERGIARGFNPGEA